LADFIGRVTRVSYKNWPILMFDFIIDLSVTLHSNDVSKSSSLEHQKQLIQLIRPVMRAQRWFVNVALTNLTFSPSIIFKSNKKYMEIGIFVVGTEESAL